MRQSDKCCGCQYYDQYMVESKSGLPKRAIVQCLACSGDLFFSVYYKSERMCPAFYPWIDKDGHTRDYHIPTRKRIRYGR